MQQHNNPEKTIDPKNEISEEKWENYEPTGQTTIGSVGADPMIKLATTIIAFMIPIHFFYFFMFIKKENAELHIKLNEVPKIHSIHKTVFEKIEHSFLLIIMVFALILLIFYIAQNIKEIIKSDEFAFIFTTFIFIINFSFLAVLFVKIRSWYDPNHPYILLSNLCNMNAMCISISLAYIFILTKYIISIYPYLKKLQNNQPE